MAPSGSSPFKTPKKGFWHHFGALCVFKKYIIILHVDGIVVLSYDLSNFCIRRLCPSLKFHLNFLKFAAGITQLWAAAAAAAADIFKHYPAINLRFDCYRVHSNRYRPMQSLGMVCVKSL
jgi:hypothetical protein